MKIEFILTLIVICLWTFLLFLILYLFAYKLPKEIRETSSINYFCFHYWIGPEDTICGKWICVTCNNNGISVDGTKNNDYRSKLR